MSDVYTVELELHFEDTHKFYRASVEGNTLTQTTGKIGNKGRTTTKNHASADKARTALNKAVLKRRKAGFFAKDAKHYEPAVELDSSGVERVEMLRVIKVPKKDHVAPLRNTPPLQLSKDRPGRFVDGPPGHHLWLPDGAPALIGSRHDNVEIAPVLEGDRRDYPHITLPVRPDNQAMLVALRDSLYEVTVEGKATPVASFEDNRALINAQPLTYGGDRDVVYRQGNSLIATIPGAESRPIAELPGEPILAATRIANGAIAALQQSLLTILKPEGDGKYEQTHCVQLAKGFTLGTWLDGRVLVVCTRVRDNEATLIYAVHGDELHLIQTTKRKLMQAFDARGCQWMVEAAPGGNVPWDGYRVFNVERVWDKARTEKPLARDGAIRLTPLHDAIVSVLDDRNDLGVNHVREMAARGDVLELRAYNELTTPLGYAAWRGSLDVAKLLIELGADPDGIATNSGRSPAATAFERGHVAIADLVLENGAKPVLPEVVEIDGKTVRTESPLVAAARHGYAEHVRTMLDTGANIDVCGHDGASVLTAAIMGNNEELALELLERGASPHTRVEGAPSALGWAVRQDLVNLAKRLAEVSDDAMTSAGGQALKTALLNIHLGEPFEPVVEALVARGKVEADAETLNRAAEAQSAPALRAILAGGVGVDEPYFTANKPARALSVVCIAKNASKEAAEVLLDAGADIDFVDKRGVTPLRYAIANNTSTDVIDLLIARGARVTRGEGAWGPMQQAAREGRNDVIDKLIEAGGDINETTGNGLAPVAIAVHQGKKETLVHLLDKGADPDAGEFTALMNAAYKGDLESLERLLTEGADLSRKATNPYVRNDSDKRTAQEHAELAGQSDAVARLVAAGGGTFATLHAAADNDDLEAMRKLLDEGANPNEPAGQQGRRPLHHVISAPAAKLLIDRGAKVDAAAKNGLTPLQHHAGGQHDAALDVIEVLLDAGVSVSGKAGMTALLYPAMWNKPAILQRLIDAGASLAARGRVRTPLHAAARQGNVECVEILLAAGADPNRFDGGGIDGRRTPLHVAAMAGNTKIVEMLIAAGAQVGLHDEDKSNYDWGCFTPIHWAASEGHYDTLVALLRHDDTGAVYQPVARGRYTDELAEDHPKCEELLRAVMNGDGLEAYLARTEEVKHAAKASEQAGEMWIERTDQKIPDGVGKAPGEVRQKMGNHDWIKTSYAGVAMLLQWRSGRYAVTLADEDGVAKPSHDIVTDSAPYALRKDGRAWLVSDKESVYLLDGDTRDTLKVLDAQQLGGTVEHVGFAGDERMFVVANESLALWGGPGNHDHDEPLWTLSMTGLKEIFDTGTRTVGLVLEHSPFKLVWARLGDDGLRLAATWEQIVKQVLPSEVAGKPCTVAYSSWSAPDVFILHHIDGLEPVGEPVVALPSKTELDGAGLPLLAPLTRSAT